MNKKEKFFKVLNKHLDENPDIVKEAIETGAVGKVEKEKKDRLILLSMDDSSCGCAPPGSEYFIIETKYSEDEIKDEILKDPVICKWAKSGDIRYVVECLNNKGIIKFLDYKEFNIGLYWLTLEMQIIKKVK